MSSRKYVFGQAVGIVFGLIGGTLIADRLFTPKTKVDQTTTNKIQQQFITTEIIQTKD